MRRPSDAQRARQLHDRKPALVIRIAFEEDLAAVFVDADSYEDELRLRHWLRRTGCFRMLRATIQHHLDWLDALDDERAA